MSKISRSVFCSLIFLACVRGYGQSYRQLERVQLSRSWVNTAQVDPLRGKIAAIVVSVNSDPEQATNIFEIEFDGGTTKFSENDLGSFGLLGVEEARRLAEREVIIKNALGLNPKLNALKIPPISLFVTTSNGIVQNFDAETGREIWTVSVGNPRYPTTAAGASNDYVAVVNGSTLYILSRKTGETKIERSLQSNPLVGIGKSVVGPTATNDWIFVPCMHGQMEAYTLENAKDPTLKFVRKPWIYRTSGEIVDRAVASSSLAGWATDAGRLLVSQVEEPEVLYRFDAEAPLAGPPSFANNHFVLAAENGFVFSVDAQSELLKWETSTGEPIRGAPLVFGKDVFVSSLDDRLICLSSEDGSRKWTANNTSRLLSVSETRVYVQDRLGNLAVVDRESGRLLATLGIRADCPIQNHQTDRLYLATSRGRLMAFEEIHSKFPTIHNKEELEKKPAEEAKPEDKPETPADTEDPGFGEDETGFDDAGFGDDEDAMDTDDMEADDTEADSFDFGADAEDDEESPFDTTDDGSGDDEDDEFDFGMDE